MGEQWKGPVSDENILEEISNGHIEFAGSDSGFYSTYEPKERNIVVALKMFPPIQKIFSILIIGRGLASTVRRCVEKITGKNFAVKIVDVSTERQSEQDAKRLSEETLSEVRLLRQLSGHPSIISIHDFFATSTFQFAVFELAPKGELFDLLNKSVTLSEKKTRSIMRQLFDGVEYMHSRNIVHRDLKLENILCIDDKRIVISDFGFAKELTSTQKLKDLFGTPGYLAPESLRCQMYENAPGYSFEVDNWALGVIMYTLLAGYAPFYHRQQLKMMRMIQEGKYEFNTQQWDTISDGAKNLISCLLTVDVNERITSREALNHKWMIEGAAEQIAKIHEDRKHPRAKLEDTLRHSQELRNLFKVAQIGIRFLCRLKNMKQLKSLADRNELRKRPFRNREIRHEAESASFDVYGHWVNRGFYYSRDMLFANNPRPKYMKNSN